MSAKSYVNAEAVLPAELVREIQKYVEASLLYIPAKSRTGWGIKSGIKREIISRNDEIRLMKKKGGSTSEISQKFFLSEETVRKIL